MEKMKELEKMLENQCMTADIDSFYFEYIKRKQAERYDNALLILDIFNYGKICGIRQERNRRRTNHK